MKSASGRSAAFSRWAVCALLLSAAGVNAAVWSQNGGAVLIADTTHAGYNDLVAAPDGTLHSVWQDRTGADRRFTIFYRSSSDGVRWSPPLDLDPSERTASTVRAVIDGAGRVYVLWKSRAPAMTTPELNDTNSLNSSHGSLIYRVLERGRWSAPARLGRQNSVYGWTIAVGPDGRAQVVWSEIADGDPDSAFDATDEATAVRRARLDGAASRAENLLTAPIGLYALHGYIDGQDRPRFAAIGGDRLYYFDGTRLTVLLNPYRAREKRMAPRLLRDRAGADHVIAFADGNVLDLRPGGKRAIVPRTSSSTAPVEDIHAAQGGNGRMFVAIALKDSISADFVVTWSDDGTWTAPVSLTGGVETARGVLTSNALGFSSTSRLLATYSSLAVEPSGAVGVLLTAGVARMNNARRYDGGYSIGVFEPKVFFTRLQVPNSVYLRAAGMSNPLPPQHQDPAQRENRPTPSPRITPKPETAPAPPAPKSSALVPSGRYACERISQYAGPLPTGQTIVITDGRYQISGGGAGTFADAGGSVKWSSGPLAAPAARATVTEKNGVPVIRFLSEGETNECTLVARGG